MVFCVIKINLIFDNVMEIISSSSTPVYCAEIGNANSTFACKLLMMMTRTSKAYKSAFKIIKLRLRK